MTTPALQWQGERCLLLRWEARVDAALNARVHAAAARLGDAAALPRCERVPAYASLALYFDATETLDHAAVESVVREALSDLADAARAATPARVIEIPVCYADELAPDLAAAAVTLGMPVDELVRRHTAPLYRVAMLGFSPGFPYLLGLDPALALPRRDQPRQHVEPGSVAIAGEQTGIYPQASPGGWQLIGRTPLRLFDPGQTPPCPLAPGDGVRFVAIDAVRFAALRQDAGA